MSTALRTIRIHAGQGDVLMAVHGLQALIELQAQFLAPDARVYTRTDTEALVRTLLPGIKTASLTQSGGAAHPRYVIVQHLSWTTVLRNWFTPDYYINFPEKRLLGSYGYPRPGLGRRMQLFLTDLKFGAGLDWRRETPAYYALRMWAPLARQLGLSEIDLARGLFMAYHTLRTRLQAHVASLPASANIPAVAFFPSGRGFQYLPPVFIRELGERAHIANGDLACYFGPKDPTMEQYRALGLDCRVTTTMDELLQVVATAGITATSDSFVSHVAQLIARQHVALMSHDIPPHTMHPAAASHIVYEPQPCSPCFYTIRDPGSRCRAGREACGVFSMSPYMNTAVAAFERARGARLNPG